MEKYLIDTFNPYITTDVERCKCEVVQEEPTATRLYVRKWPETTDPDNGGDTNPIDHWQWFGHDKSFYERFKTQEEYDPAKVKAYQQLSQQKCSAHEKALKYDWSTKNGNYHKK